MPKSNENLRELLEARVRKHAEKTFLFSEIDGREWTNYEFDKAVREQAQNLRLHIALTNVQASAENLW